MTNREKLAAYKLEIAPLPDEDGGGYQALYPRLARTVVGYGETPSGALEDLTVSLELLLTSLEAAGEELPAPEPQADWHEFSGRVTLRLPKSLHYRLDRLKDAEGVSLNTLISDMLQAGVTALEAGMLFGAVDDSRGTTAQVLDEILEMRDLLDGLALRESPSASAATTSEWLDPVRMAGFSNFEFKRLVA